MWPDSDCFRPAEGLVPGGRLLSARRHRTLAPSMPAQPALPLVIARAFMAVASALCMAAGYAASVQLTVHDSHGKPLADAVLLLQPAGAKAALKPAANVEIAQRSRRFVPAVTVVPVGT